jgi:KipI family sensor histidine kinase inhibitor
LPAGDAALVVELGSVIDAELNDAVHRLDAAINAAKPAGLIETVPTYRSILVLFDPVVAAAEDMGRACLDLAGALDRGRGATPSRRWRVPVAFGGALGEDLPLVAAQSGLSEAAVVALHCRTDYRVYMLGFAPGFPYMGTLAPELRLPRRENPRLAVPAGSVIQGGQQAAIMPLEMPSGWHILGRTPVRLRDDRRAEPFLLAPGDVVRFAAMDPAELPALEARAAAGDPIATREDAS